MQTGPAQEATRPLGPFGIPTGQQHIRQNGNRQIGDQKGNNQRGGDGDGQCLEKSPGHPGQKGQRREDNDRRCRRTRHWLTHFQRGMQHRHTLPRVFADAPHNMFEHDYGVVHHQPHRGCHTAQRHNVKTLMKHIENQHTGQQHAGQDDGNDEGQPQITEESKEHQCSQCGSDKNRIPDTGCGRRDQLALVIPGADFYSGRDAVDVLTQQSTYGTVNRHRIGSELLFDVNQHCRLAIGGDCGPLGNYAGVDLRHITEIHHAVGAGFEDGVADIPSIFQGTFAEDLVKAVMALKTSHRSNDITIGEGMFYISETQAVALQAHGVNDHLIFCLRTALNIHLCYAVDSQQQGAQVIVGIMAQGHRIKTIGSQGKTEDGKNRRVHAPGAEAGIGRQPRECAIDGRLRLQQGRSHVGTPGKLHGDLRRAPSRGGTNALDARHCAQGLLQRASDGNLCLRDGHIARICGNHDARKGDIREQGHGHFQRHQQTRQHQHHQHEKQRTAVPLQPVTHQDLPATRRAMPSCSS